MKFYIRRVSWRYSSDHLSVESRIEEARQHPPCARAEFLGDLPPPETLPLRYHAFMHMWAIDLDLEDLVTLVDDVGRIIIDDPEDGPLGKLPMLWIYDDYIE